jgi:acetoacetyl-CoA synthetase
MKPQQDEKRVSEGDILWEPDDAFIRNSNIFHYMEYLDKNGLCSATDYNSLWRWSVSDIEVFWKTIAEYFQVRFEGKFSRVVSSYHMPGVRWFEGAKLNYVDYLLKNRGREGTSMISVSESRERKEVSWDTLFSDAGKLQNTFGRLGIRAGDRIAAYLPNISEAVESFVATAASGAIWSSCSPDFGSGSVIDRFRQIDPKLLITVDGYTYGGRSYDRLETVERIVSEIPSIKNVILIPYLNQSAHIRNALMWDDIVGGKQDGHAIPAPCSVEFNHPLWILYSSGTTGLPKPIVHSHGGILLEHLKTHFLHFDLAPEDTFFWLTTTGWMMWNVVASALLPSSRIVLFDGNPSYPDLNTLWRIAEQERITHFGTGAAYILSCRKEGIIPGENFDLKHLRAISSTGSPLLAEEFEWVYRSVRDDIWLSSVSGGTDVCSGFVLGCPLLPVRAGKIQCRALGASVYSFDEKGNSLIDEVGELVITKPMPSMPVFFWNDADMSKYRESYFEQYEGIWRHGDWVKISEDGSLVIYGRSDATLKRRGIRIGTAEIYRVVENTEEVTDSMVIGIDLEGGRYYMPLFVVLRPGIKLDDNLKRKIEGRIRKELSPRHVPDDIIQVNEIPRTLTGKKLEVPVKRVLSGLPAEKTVNPGSVANMDALNSVIETGRRAMSARFGKKE